MLDLLAFLLPPTDYSGGNEQSYRRDSLLADEIASQRHKDVCLQTRDKTSRDAVTKTRVTKNLPVI